MAVLPDGAATRSKASATGPPALSAEPAASTQMTEPRVTDWGGTFVTGAVNCTAPLMLTTGSAAVTTTGSTADAVPAPLPTCKVNR